MRKYILLILLTVTLIQARSQGVGIGTGTPNASAQLEVSSSTKGVLISRMTTAQRKAIVNPAVGLLVYDLDKKTIYMYDNTKWLPMMFSTGENKLPPIAHTAGDGMPGDYFGYSAAINGNYAIVGAPFHDDGNTQRSGCAYIFFRSGGVWTQQAKIVASDAVAFEQFGYSVDISGNFAIVGAPFSNNGPAISGGKAYIFARSGPSWSQNAILLPNDGATDDRFGHSVGISGNFAIVGSAFDDGVAGSDQGSAYIFNGSNGWFNGLLPAAKLTANDGAAMDNYGSSVDINGDYVIVGSPYDQLTFADQGSAYVYYRFTNPTGWSSGQIHQSKLIAFNGGLGDTFGYSVAIGVDRVVVGAPQKDVGTNSSQGTVYFYQRSGVTWLSISSFTPPDGEEGLFFGLAVDIDQDYILVGSMLDNVDEILYQGSAYLLKFNGSIYFLQRKINDANGESGSYFGFAVGISGSNIIIGARSKYASKGEIAFLNIE